MRVTLDNGKSFLIDDDDYERFKNFNWRYEKSPNGSGGYVVAIIKMHRLVTNAKKGEEIDHINHDKLDNRKENLRKVTHSENCQNRPLNKRNKSGYKGVHWFKNEKKWSARLGVNGKRIFLGYFDNKKDAAKAYDIAAKKHFGSLAFTNFK